MGTDRKKRRIIMYSFVSCFSQSAIFCAAMVGRSRVGLGKMLEEYLLLFFRSVVILAPASFSIFVPILYNFGVQIFTKSNFWIFRKSAPGVLFPTRGHFGSSPLFPTTKFGHTNCNKIDSLMEKGGWS